MPDAQDGYGNVFKNGTATLLARIVNFTGCDYLLKADFAVGGSSSSSSGECGWAAVYTVYLLDDQDPDSRTLVAGHTNVKLDPLQIIFDTLQTGCLATDNIDGWTEDSIGYNFRHTIDTCTNEAFAIAGRNYLVEYRLITLADEEIYVRFRLACI